MVDQSEQEGSALFFPTEDDVEIIENVESYSERTDDFLNRLNGSSGRKKRRIQK